MHKQIEGLPSEEQMRADLEVASELQRYVVGGKLADYRKLFERFKAGDNLTDQELEKMANLSGELSKTLQAE